MENYMLTVLTTAGQKQIYTASSKEVGAYGDFLSINLTDDGRLLLHPSMVLSLQWTRLVVITHDHKAKSEDTFVSELQKGRAERKATLYG